MKSCLLTCKEHGVTCPISDCRNWVDYPSEFNCVLETVNRGGFLTLREAALRLKISFVRVKQIEDAALKKIGHLLKKESI